MIPMPCLAWNLLLHSSISILSLLNHGLGFCLTCIPIHWIPLFARTLLPRILFFTVLWIFFSPSFPPLQCQYNFSLTCLILMCRPPEREVISHWDCPSTSQHLDPSVGLNIPLRNLIEPSPSYLFTWQLECCNPLTYNLTSTLLFNIS